MKGVALDFVDYGYNFRMSELQAIMGLKQLRKLDDIVDERNAIRQAYIEQLTPLGYQPQSLPGGVRHNVQSLVFVVPSKVDRDGLIAHLKSKEIESTIGTYALSATTYYRNRYDAVQANYNQLNDNTITLPCYSGVDVESVVAGMATYSVGK